MGTVSDIRKLKILRSKLSKIAKTNQSMIGVYKKRITVLEKRLKIN